MQKLQCVSCISYKVGTFRIDFIVSKRQKDSTECDSQTSSVPKGQTGAIDERRLVLSEGSQM